MKKEALGVKHLLGAGNFIHLFVVLTIILLLREWGLSEVRSSAEAHKVGSGGHQNVLPDCKTYVLYAPLCSLLGAGVIYPATVNIHSFICLRDGRRYS